MKLKKYQRGFLGELITAGASLIGGASANRANIKQAETQMAFQNFSTIRQMEFQTAANQKAMDFSERMSSTAHQREVKDLRLAGLNPILSSKYGGSSTPSGVSSSGASSSGAQAKIHDIVTPAAQTLLAAKMGKATVAKTKAETTNLAATAKNIDADTKLKNKQTEKGTQEISESHRRVAKMMTDELHVRKQTALVIMETKSAKQRIDLLRTETDISKQTLKAMLTKFPALKEDEKIDVSTYGIILRWLSRMNPLGGGTIPTPQRAIIVRGK